MGKVPSDLTSVRLFYVILNNNDSILQILVKMERSLWENGLSAPLYYDLIKHFNETMASVTSFRCY